MERTKCDNNALFRYTWAGQNERVACIECAAKLKTIADAMGYHLQLIQLSQEDLLKEIKCMQKREKG